MRIATITPVFNEEDMIKQFLDHYAWQMDTVFLLDNESTDGTLRIAAKYPNVKISSFSTGQTFKDVTHNAEMEKVRAACVGKFDFVLFVDADEFVHPKAGGAVRDQLVRMGPADILPTDGFNMFPGPEEKKYDPAIPLILQRRWGYFSAHYSKPIIVRPEAQVEYGPGRHWVLKTPERTEIFFQRPTPFFMLHYVGIDEEIWVKRRLDGRIRRMSQENRRLGLSGHYFQGDDASLRYQFRNEPTTPGFGKVL